MILDLHEKLKSKKISATELAKHYLTRAKSDKTNSYITLSENEALENAKSADAVIAKGEQKTLTGIPLGIKDVLCTKGVRTTCASKILGEYKPPYDATSIAKLKSQNMVMLGKLNMDEFAMGGSNENSAFGAVKNPVNLDYVPGGSSGGSAAAVKAGIAAATLGSDTGGSVRLPASYCGVVGLKPTYGRISRYGLVAFASSLDQIGPMTVNVDDSAILLSAMAGKDPMDSTCAPRPTEDFLSQANALLGSKKKFKIGLPKEYFIGGLQSEVQKSIDDVKAALEKDGHSFTQVSLPHTQYAVAVYYIVAVSEASSNLARFDGVRYGSRKGGEEGLSQLYKQSRAQFGEEVKRRIILGTYALSAGYYDAYFRKACQVRRLMKNDFDEAFKQVDILMTPTAPTTAYKIGAMTKDPLEMYLNDILTIPTNLAGLPGISVPCGRDAKGLPIGVQFLAPQFEETRILAAGKMVESLVYKEEVNHGF